jgi:hypothetical protein
MRRSGAGAPVGHPETPRTLVFEGDGDDDRRAAWARVTLEAALLDPGRPR